MQPKSAEVISLKSATGAEPLGSLGHAARDAMRPNVEMGKGGIHAYHDMDGDIDDEIEGGHMHGGAESGSSIPAAIFNLLKTIIGAGIFTMPSAFYGGGFFISIILLLGIGAIVDWTITILVRTGVEANLKDYERLVKHATGNVGYVIYLAAALMFAYGGCSAYSVVIADRFPSVLNSFSGINYEDLASDASSTLKFFMDRRISVTIISILVLFPVSSLRYLKSLATFSFMGILMFAWVALTSIVVAWTLEEGQGGSRDPADIYTFVKPAGLIGVLSRAAFSVVCHHNQFMIYRSIKNPSLKRYFVVSHTSIWISVMLGILFGILGYIPLVEKAASGNILNTLPEDNIWVKIASLAFCIDVILTYPLELYVCRDILEKLVHGKNRHNVKPMLRLLYTALLVAGTIIISVSVCDLNAVVDLTGGIASAIIAFIFPPILYVVMKRRNSTKPIPLIRFIPHFLVVLFGLFMSFYTVYDVISSVVSSSGDGVCKYKFL